MADNNRAKRTSAPTQQVEVEDAAQPVVDVAGLAEAVAAVAPSAPVAPYPAGGISLAGMGLPVGFGSTTLSEDKEVSSRMQEMAPTFGDVLLSIGMGVASSQEALDKSLRETVTQLASTKIDVVTEVIQELNEDGVPDPSKTRVVKQKSSLINHVSPTVHEWEFVAVSMDMTVGAMSAEHGIKFSQNQTRIGGGLGGSWGFGGWFSLSGSHSETDHESRNKSEAEWASGQVRMDAKLAARPVEKLPVGADIGIGPQISFSQGALREKTENGITRRQVEITVQVRKQSGAVNPGKPLTIEVTPFNYSAVNGSVTSLEGKVVVNVFRDVPTAALLAPTRGKLVVKLGQITRTLDVTL